MSKHKEIDKKLETKELEKLRFEKNFKREIKEFKEKDKDKEKEKPEKIEIKEGKEIKEFKEKIEIKERIKEFKELEKKIFEKGGKEIVEVPDLPGGELFRAEKPEEGGAPVAKPKEDQELKIQKEIEKIKPEKEFPDKIQKEIEKIKPEKEFEKYKEKELEKFKPEKEFPDKLQKELEKFKAEKEFEKGIVETPEDPTTREPLFKRSGSAEDRLGQLEDAVTKLTHFIGVDLRPDLTTGALKGEPDVGGAHGGGGEEKPDDKKKPK
jgi:hypothetical protein